MSSNIGSVTSRIINKLNNDGNRDKASLAALRYASSIDDHKMSTVWPLLFDELDADQLSSNGKPTYSEIAVFAALRGYAIYQQGIDNFVFSTGDDSLEIFQALGQLRKDEKLRVALDRRVQATLSKMQVNSVINDVIHLISILKSNRKAAGLPPINFARFARDIVYYQTSPAASRQVCLKWGEQYFSMKVETKEETNK
ncbi:type I-E CRISPR-associated protein Cse2/CasB [Lactobacillus corticis]|uniref:Type I-E CRISPR-associated protein Cse2/CasB n=1 Tax=Lactobacillus corticis TaxID=2201249 RepID=A0A916QF34_9LACO|nr:type I-E CRISPR-associated protein Cse2/CasB [Lactobacillus corticis]GFZ26134.1 hypothetical protein LCB40_00140 [Lactobacillus corticis]